MLTLDDNLRKQLATEDPEARRILESAERMREAEIARLAVEYHRAGYVVIAIPPDTSDFEEAIAALKACYRAHRKPTRHGSARVTDWLAVIQEFEQGELQPSRGHKRHDQLFARYRRAIGRWKWS